MTFAKLKNSTSNVNNLIIKTKYSNCNYLFKFPTYRKNMTPNDTNAWIVT